MLRSVLAHRRTIVAAQVMSPKARDAIQLLALEIARARRERRWTAQELAQRAGVSRPTLRAVENASPTVAIGTVYEIATILGISMFGSQDVDLPSLVDRSRDRLALLPVRVRPPTAMNDDF